MICRAISAQFMSNERIAMFELTVEDDEIRVVDERHYRLVAGKDITADDLVKYGTTPE